MSKLASYVLGVAAVLVFTYYILSRDYSPLINWLGPVLGPSMIFPLSFLYLLLGDIFQFPMLFLIWILIGAIIGVVCAKGGKAIGSAIAVYFTVWLFLLVSAIPLILKLTTGSFSITTLPPVPQGSSIDAIIGEPLFAQLISLVLQMSGIALPGAAASTATSASSSFIVIAKIFLPYLIINLAVLLIVSYFVGMLLHKFFFKKPQSGSPVGVDNNSEVKENRSRRSDRKLKTAIIVVSIVILSSFLPMLMPFGGASALQSSSNLAMTGSSSALQNSGLNSHGESMAYLNSTLGSTGYVVQSAADTTNSTYNLSNFTSLYYGGGVIGSYGNFYNLYAFLKRDSSLSSNMLDPNGTSGSLFSIVAISNNVTKVFDYLSQDSIISVPSISTISGSQFFDMMPQTLIINAFPGNLTQTKTMASRLASNITHSIGASSPREMIGFPVNVSNADNQNEIVSLYVYSSSSNTYTVENNILALTSSEFSNSGTLTPFISGISSGYLVPGHTSSSVDSSIFLVGQLNLEYFGGVTSSFTSPLNAGGFLNDTKSISLMGGIFAKGMTVHSSATTHNFSASQIFNYYGDISFNDSKTVYALSLTYPNPNGSTIAGLSKYSTVFYVSIANVSIPLGTSSSSIQVVQGYGSNLGLQGVSVQANVTFPANLAVSQSYKILSHNVVQVKVDLKNNDTDQVSNLVLNANRFFPNYKGTYSVINGSTSLSQGVLAPGQSVTLEYTLNMSGIGSYIVSAPLVNYTINGTPFSVIVGKQVIIASYPSMLSSVNGMALATFTLVANAFPSTHFLVQNLFDGFYFFDLVPLLLAILAVFFEYRSYSKWKASRKT